MAELGFRVALTLWQRHQALAVEQIQLLQADQLSEAFGLWGGTVSPISFGE